MFKIPLLLAVFLAALIGAVLLITIGFVFSFTQLGRGLLYGGLLLGRGILDRLGLKKKIFSAWI